MTGSWSNGSSSRSRCKAVCTSPTQPKRSPRKAKSSRLERASASKTAKLVPLDVQVGDRILFGKYSGSDIKLDSEEYMIMREDEVLGMLEGASKAAKKIRSRNYGETDCLFRKFPSSDFARR